MLKKNRNENFKIKNDIIQEKACGKLYILGEYSILIPGQKAIIKNINIYLTASIKFSLEYKLYSDMYNHYATMEYDKEYSLIQETIKIINEYLKEKGVKLSPFEINITGKMEKEGKKYGIGSSGSVVVVTIKAIFKLYKYELNSEILFKLASYILLKSGDNGSMGDVACIAYESLVFYKSFDREKIKEKMKKESLLNIINSNWNYEIKRIFVKEKYGFFVGWTKNIAISKDMISNTKKNIKSSFLLESDKNVEKFLKGVKDSDKSLIKESIKNADKILKSLNKNIYNDKLINLVEATKNLDICAKSSGAGGGDCGIAISFKESDIKIMLSKWIKNDILLLYSSNL